MAKKKMTKRKKDVVVIKELGATITIEEDFLGGLGGDIDAPGEASDLEGGLARARAARAARSR